MEERCCLIVLEGQGDTMVGVMTEELFAWVMRPDTPGRVGDEGMWIDAEAPAGLEECEVTIGSFQNDRAIQLLSAGDAVEGVLACDSLREAIAHIQEHGMEVVGEFHGGIY